MSKKQQEGHCGRGQTGWDKQMLGLDRGRGGRDGHHQLEKGISGGEDFDFSLQVIWEPFEPLSRGETWAGSGC